MCAQADLSYFERDICPHIVNWSMVGASSAASSLTVLHTSRGNWCSFPNLKLACLWGNMRPKQCPPTTPSTTDAGCHCELGHHVAVHHAQRGGLVRTACWTAQL